MKNACFDWNTYYFNLRKIYWEEKKNVKQVSPPFPQRLCCRNKWQHHMSLASLSISQCFLIQYNDLTTLINISNLSFWTPLILYLLGCSYCTFWVAQSLYLTQKKQEQLLFIIDRYKLDNEWYKSPGSYFVNLM